MEQWAANTLRTVGIILTACFVLVATLFLLLLSMCAYGGDFSGHKNPGQGLAYLVGAGVVIALGIVTETWLARGIMRSRRTAVAYAGSAGSVGAPLPVPEPAIPAHLSPASRKAIDNLVLAMGAQIAVSIAAWFWGQLRFWTNPQPNALRPHNWTLVLLAPFILYHLPYVILIYRLLKKLDRRTLAYSLAVPCVMLVQALFTVTLVIYTYAHNPVGFLLLFVPWAIHIVILVLAWQLIQRIGVPPTPSSLIVAALVTFVYLWLIHGVTPLLYRFAWSYR